MGSMAAGAVTGAIFKSTGSSSSFSADICSYLLYIDSWHQTGHCCCDSNIRYGRHLELCEKKRLMFVYITLKFPLSWLSHLGWQICEVTEEDVRNLTFRFFSQIPGEWWTDMALIYFQNLRWYFASFRFHVSGFGRRPSREYYKCSCGWMTPSHFTNADSSWSARSLNHIDGSIDWR